MFTRWKLGFKIFLHPLYIFSIPGRLLCFADPDPSGSETKTRNSRIIMISKITTKAIEGHSNYMDQYDTKLE